MGHGDRRGTPGRGRLHRQRVLDVRARRRGAPGAPRAGSVRTASAVQPATSSDTSGRTGMRLPSKAAPETAVESRTRAAACTWTLLRCVYGSTPRWSLHRSAGARWPCQRVALGVTLTLDLGLIPRWSRCWMRRPRSWARWSSRPCWPPSRSASASSRPCRCTRRCAWTARRATFQGVAHVCDGISADVWKRSPAVGAGMAPLICCASQLACGERTCGSARYLYQQRPLTGAGVARPDRAHPRHALLGSRAPSATRRARCWRRARRSWPTCSSCGRRRREAAHPSPRRHAFAAGYCITCTTRLSSCRRCLFPHRALDMFGA